ncbi:MAG: hypothetical protein AAF483_13360 [Planctomycetota bacterium]
MQTQVYSTMELRNLVKVLVVVLFCICIPGCEDIPDFGYAELEVNPEAVTRDGRDEYTWTYDGGFAVRRPLDFTFFENVDREKIAKVVRGRQAASAGGSPVWLTDEEMKLPEGAVEYSYSRLTSLTQGHEPIRPSVKLPVDDQTAAVGFDLSPDGKYLAVVGDTTKVVETGNGKEICDLPVSQALAARFAGDSGELVIQQDNLLTRMNIKSGEVICTWDSPAKIAAIDSDAKGENWVVLTEDGALFALDKEFKSTATLAAGAAVGGSVSMHPSGAWVLANSPKGPLKWNLRGLGRAPDLLPAEAYEANAICRSGSKVDVWIGQNYCHAYREGKPITYRDTPGLVLFPEVKFAELCDWGKDDSSFTLLVARQPDEQNNWRIFLQDQQIEGGHFSWPMPLEFMPLDFCASNDGEIVAMSSEEEIIVFHRRRWVDPFGGYLVESLKELVLEDRIQEFEFCLTVLTDEPYLRGGKDPQELVGECLISVGAYWGSVHRGEHDMKMLESAELLKKFEDWRATGSTFAIAASAVRYLNRCYWAATWEDREKLFKLTMDEIKLLERDFLLASLGIALKMELMARFEQAGQQELDPLLAEYMELTPASLRAHYWIAEWMEHSGFEWLGTSEDRFSYTSAVADLYPSDVSDYTYAQLVVYTTHRTRSTMNLAGAKRFHRGLLEMMDRKAIGPTDVMPIYKAFQARNVAGMIEDLNEYAVRNFGCLPPTAYSLSIPENLVQVRDESRRLANRKSNSEAN